MVDRVVDQVEGWLAFEVETKRDGYPSLALHLELELSKKSSLLASHGERHVLAFVGTEAGIPDQFTLPSDRPTSRHEEKGCPRATSFWAGNVACITVTPQLCRRTLLVAKVLPTSCLEVAKHMLKSHCARLGLALNLLRLLTVAAMSDQVQTAKYISDPIALL